MRAVSLAPILLTLLVSPHTQAGGKQTKACWEPYTASHAQNTLCWFRESWTDPKNTDMNITDMNKGILLLGGTKARFDVSTKKFIKTCVYQPREGEPFTSSTYFALRSPSLDTVENMSFDNHTEAFLASADMCDDSTTLEFSSQDQTPSSDLDRVCKHFKDEIVGGLHYSTIEFRYRDTRGFCTEKIGAKHLFFHDGSLATVYWVAAVNNGWPIVLKKLSDDTIDLIYEEGGNKVANEGICQKQSADAGHPIAVYDNKRCKTGYVQDPKNLGNEKRGRANTGFENLAQPWPSDF